MNDARPPQIRPQHLRRLALVYLRQSTLKQVEEHTGSTTYQRNQKAYPLRWGWAETDIEVIEQDLGLSGTSGEHRQGWQRLLRLISDNRAGIIFVSDISRLSRSRNDFNSLVVLCREFDVLLVVDGAIVQFDNPHDTFMANIRADVAEYDNAIRKNTLMKAKWTKARQGHAVSPCPAGYVFSRKGQWDMDPDAPVRDTIREVFRQFEALGSAGKVVRFFNNKGLTLPVRRGSRNLRWVRPSLSGIYKILTNPAYCGTYTYGRRRPKGGALPDGRTPPDWDDRITIPDHHKAYISPAEWQRILDQLRRNNVHFRQPAGRGRALCQGLVRCGRCGRAMTTQYNYSRRRAVAIQYVCDQARLQFGEPACWRVNGRRLDEVVAAEILRGLTPPEVDAVLAAADEENTTHESIRRQRQAELDRARLAAQLAERRFKLAEPENRHVRVGLEQDWELALRRLREVERTQADAPVVPPLEVTPESLHAIRSLAADVPGLWVAPSTTDQDRKFLIRLLVREIRVINISDADFEVEIAWVGGATTQHRIARPFAGTAIARQLAAQGLDENQIAAQLNQRGLRTVFKGGAYTAVSLRRVFQYHARKAGAAAAPPWHIIREELRAPLTELVQAGWSDAAIAAEFTRRGLRGFASRQHWNGKKVQHLRRLLSIPSVGTPRVRLPKASISDAERLRTSLTELVEAGWSDGVIAVEFNRRDLPKWGYRTPWNKAKVCNLRRTLGIPSVRGPRVRLRKASPAKGKQNEWDEAVLHPEPAGPVAGSAYSEPITTRARPRLGAVTPSAEVAL